MINTALKLPDKVELGWGVVLHVYVSVAFLVYNKGRILHILVLFVIPDMEHSSSLVQGSEAPSASLSAVA